MSYFIKNNLYCFKQGSFLSNFYNKSFLYKGKEWPTSEHAYQAMKSNEEAVQEWVRKSPTAAVAKRRGREIAIRRDWDYVKIDVMDDILHYKFNDAELMYKLQQTYPYELVEYTWWGDTFFGVNENFEGLNHLGKILTNIRNEYRLSVLSPG